MPSPSEAENHHRRRHHLSLVEQIREKLIEGNVSEIREKIIAHRDRALAGEFLHPSPPVETTDTILFFLPPGAEPSSNLYPGLLPGDPIPIVTSHPPFQTKSQDFVNRFWSYLTVLDTFILSIDPYTTNHKKEGGQKIFLLTHRFTANFKNAATLVIEGYNGFSRRTGEPEALHSLRNFISVHADRLPHTVDETWILYTSLLSSLLHDVKEDFKDVAFTKKEGTKDEYLLTCIGKNGRPLQTSFHLDSFETELLQKQLKALTTPVPSPGMTDEEKAQLQFNHLRINTMAIAGQFGPLAAFYTLLVKWKDRFENLCTYWKWDHQNGKRYVEAESFLRKLRESHYYFTAVEADAMEYLAAWAYVPSTISTQEKEAYSRFIAKTRLFFNSVVSFCEILFFGGTYEELLTKSAKQYLEERKEKAKIKDKKRRQEALREFELKYLFFLPTLGPLPQPTRFF